MPSDARLPSFDRDQLATFRYETVFLSDFHLGSGKTATPYLYEFLKHLDYTALKSIYLVGDIVGGWEHQNEKQKPLPEMERRVLDILNYAAANGVTVHYLPGNHDEKLRPLLASLQKRGHEGVFSKNVLFSDEAWYETGGPDNRRIKIIHGDQHDPNLFVRPWFRPVTAITSAAYDFMVVSNYHVSAACYKHLGIHVSYAKGLKNAFKNVIGYFFSHESLLKGLDDKGVDGILMGHTHMAGLKKLNNKGRESWLINDGDWVESGTCAYVDRPGMMPQILNYRAERERRGFDALPDTGDPHPAHFAAFRAQTDRQARLIHRLWPARNRTEKINEFGKSLRKTEFYEREIGDLRAIMQTLGETARIDEKARRRLSAIIDETSGESYPSQKKGLAGVFNRNAADRPLTGDDYIYAKTVIREFSVRSERKLRKHREIVKECGEKLDFSGYRSGAPGI